MLQFWLSLLLLAGAAAMPSSFRAPGTPVCSCRAGTYLTELRSDSLRARWAEEQGLKWGWRPAGKAFWFLCEPCHARAWPEDGRGNGKEETGKGREARGKTKEERGGKGRGGEGRTSAAGMALIGLVRCIGAGAWTDDWARFGCSWATCLSPRRRPSLLSSRRLRRRVFQHTCGQEGGRGGANRERPKGRCQGKWGRAGVVGKGAGRTAQEGAGEGGERGETKGKV